MTKTLNVNVEYTAKVSGYVKYSVDVDVALKHFGVNELTDIPAQDLREFLSTCVQDYVSADGVDDDDEDDDTPDHVKQFVESGEEFNYVICEDVHSNGPEITLDLATVEYKLEAA